MMRTFSFYKPEPVSQKLKDFNLDDLVEIPNILHLYIFKVNQRVYIKNRKDKAYRVIQILEDGFYYCERLLVTTAACNLRFRGTHEFDTINGINLRRIR